MDTRWAHPIPIPYAAQPCCSPLITHLNMQHRRRLIPQLRLMTGFIQGWVLTITHHVWKLDRVAFPSDAETTTVA
ncbi:hypothetical protein CGRA01v4_09593 [Colletotrichum graminicola]|nr:hypothetical protein CGRA01v4_09593 [Colletotrichum graminicola]